MGKSKKPSVAFESLKALFKAVKGIKVEEKAGWVKLEGPNGHRIYVAKQDAVTQVDLSGFGKGYVGTLPLKQPNGRVQAHLDLAHPNVLAHFVMLQRVMLTLEATPKAERKGVDKKAAPKADAVPAGDSLPVTKLTGEAAEKRRALIARVTKEKGLSL